jgi:tetratricopeptide (TPR) repeat protein
MRRRIGVAALAGSLMLGGGAAEGQSVSCTAEAQAEFNRAVVLLHHMTYPAARQGFERVAALDPRCAMAHWGVAMTLFQPLWPTRPGPAELRRGSAEADTAMRLAPPTDRERRMIGAVAAFFRDPESPDYWLRIRRWEQAMSDAYTAFPHDDEVTAFSALAHLAVAPADTASHTHSDRAVMLLAGILEHNPDHPGAEHYMVHANDAPGRERDSPDVVRRYAASAPRNPHALHMPTHIYTRLGDWDAVVRGNGRAADAALAFPAGEHGEFVWDEFPHAIEYLVYAHLQRGADGEAAKQVARLVGTARLQPTFKTAFHLSSTRARYALERHAWAEAMALPVREPATLDWDRFAWPEAVTWFARGLGAARQSRGADAQSAAVRLAALEIGSGASGEPIFTRNIRMLRLEVEAWVMHLAGDSAASHARTREAAELEVATPKHAVTPAPTLPAYELLGDLLLDDARPREALEAYRRSLELYPRRFNSLLGAARAARASGAHADADSLYRALLQVAARGSRRPGVAEARAFVSRRRDVRPVSSPAAPVPRAAP